MANTSRQNVEGNGENGGQTSPNGELKTWTQPIRYHQISATGRGRGYFIRVPHLPVIDDIAKSYGPEMAQIWYKAALRQLTQLGQARAGAKEVPQTREAEQAAAEASFAEFANGSLKMRGDNDEDDEDDKVDGGKFNTLLLAACRDTLIASLAAIDKGPEYLDQAFKQYYPTLVERFGPAVAAQGYTPTKKGASKDKTAKVDLAALVLPPA
jgi:hypothetical protein